MDISEITIDAGALTVAALDYGNAEAPPLLLTHGIGDSAWSLDPLARALADRFHVLALDLRGHGGSDWGAYTLPHFVGDLAGVCETLGLRSVVLVGHSLGGQAVAQFCGLYPELARAAVLIEAIGPPPRRREREDPAGHERDWTRARADLVRQPATLRPQPSLAAAVERFQRAHPLLDPERAAFIVDRNTVAEADGSRRWRHDPATRDWIAGHDHDRAEQRWQGIRCPVQVILGRDAYDTFWSRSSLLGEALEGPITPQETARRLSNFTDARLVEIEGAGHMVHYDAPEELNRSVVEFLAEVAPGPPTQARP